MPQTSQISSDHISRIMGLSRPCMGVMFCSARGGRDSSARVVEETVFPILSMRSISSSSVTALESVVNG